MFNYIIDDDMCIINNNLILVLLLDKCIQVLVCTHYYQFNNM